MMGRHLAALAMLGLLATPAGAQIRLDRPIGSQQPPSQPQQPEGGLITTLTTQQLVRLLAPAGFGKGEPLKLENNLKAVKMDLNGTPVFALMAGCEGDNCSSFSFFTFFGKQPVDQAFINAYNRDRRFGRLYVDKDGGVVLSMDVYMMGGVSANYIAASGSIYGSAIKGVLEYKPE